MTPVTPFPAHAGVPSAALGGATAIAATPGRDSVGDRLLIVLDHVFDQSLAHKFGSRCFTEIIGSLEDNFSIFLGDVDWKRDCFIRHGNPLTPNVIVWYANNIVWYACSETCGVSRYKCTK